MMSLQDRYGNALGTQSVAARDAYQAGVDSLMAATPGMDTAFQKSVEADETFALGHIALARAKQLLGRAHEAKEPLARAKELAGGASPREQSQIIIFEKILTGQGAAALEAIRAHMKEWPRDAMALAPATSVFGLIGFSGKTGREVDQLALLEPFEKHYGDDWWYRTQLAFAQIELHKLDEGRRNIDAALESFPRSAHAAHIRGHLFYELGEREAGLAFLREWMKDYSRDGLMHVHNSWHLALWSMETGRMEDAWRIYDEALRPAVAWGPQIKVRRAVARIGRLQHQVVRTARPRLCRHAHGAGLRDGRRRRGAGEVHGESEGRHGRHAAAAGARLRGLCAGRLGARHRRDRTAARHARAPGRQPRATRPARVHRDLGDGESRPQRRGSRPDREAAAAERQGQGLPAGGTHVILSAAKDLTLATEAAGRSARSFTALRTTG
jgi:tetratricopeptide (TPR) repeat protein